MFWTRILAGEYCVGNCSMKISPNKPNVEPYDSACDANAQIFICYQDNQCYPEYKIKYSDWLLNESMAYI